uniref:Uncharacterized protein n=1 Tax=Tanacetum cinerariifolium TaxID=118510 RepID=A0A6L2MW64_TANCI|nr:hypothetical protein [Tanacetum cinerariifolium]
MEITVVTLVEEQVSLWKDVNLLKEDVSTVLVWVKLRGVPVTAFREGDLSSIATKLGTPIMIDSYIADMCMQSWGMSSYAGAMIMLRAYMELKDNIIVAMPKITRRAIIHVPSVLSMSANLLGMHPVSNKKQGVDLTNKISVSNTFEVVNSVDNDVEMEYPDDHDSEDEVALVDNDMARSMASERIGFDTQSLREQWMDSYRNGDYDEDSYDEDMYEAQNLTE